MIFETEGAAVSRPALLEDYGIAVVQHDTRTVRVTGFFELRNLGPEFSAGRRRWLTETTMRHVRGLAGARLVETGVGYRPCTPDQLPLIGRVPGYGNCFVASGNCRLGVTLAPVTGFLISSMIEGAVPEEEEDVLALTDPARFG